MISRRSLLAAGLPALALRSALAATTEGPQPLGVVIHSYGNRVAADRARGGPDRIDDPHVFLEYCHALGATGIQVGIGARPAADCDQLRERATALGMDLEGTIRLPRDSADADRFAAEVESARRSGARVLRTVMFDGRRYETFSTSGAFRKAADQAVRSLALAEPIAAKHGARLAVENHKDWRADELIALLKRIDGPHVGVCLDTGNSIALLEDPMEVVEALAPWTFTTHIKDMAVQEYEQGFLLAEVPLGAGFLDLPRMVRVVRAARPDVRLNLEMITRDPLKVPCLTDNYWATFETLPGRCLARALALVRGHTPKHPLPTMSTLTPEERTKAEDDNVRRCLASARTVLKV